MGKHKKKSKSHKEKKHKHKHKKKHYSSSDSSSTSGDEWVEKDHNLTKTNEKDHKTSEKPHEREDWMNITSLPGLFSHKDVKKQNDDKKRVEKEADKYDPKTSVRELNPYWRDGGEGLPSMTKTTKFLKPADDFKYKKYNTKRTSNWRKKSPEKEDEFKHSIREIPTSSRSSDIIYESEEKTNEVKKPNELSSEFLTDKEMNELAAKIVKAEILGNLERVTELKQKLETARSLRADQTNNRELDEEMLLTKTNSTGFSKPIVAPSNDPYDNKRKKKPVNTHDSGKRQKYYPDDGKYSLQNMFENEKYGTQDKQDEEFMKAAAKLSKSDDLEDMFMDNIRKKESEEKTNQKERDRAIREHQKMSQSLDTCQHCIQSSAMLKHLVVSLGETVFLTLPQYEPLTDGHCFIVPVRHVTCSTQLDENEWAEVLEFRKSLTNMFKKQHKTVLFYETAVNLNRYPHMLIHCVPVPEEQGDLAPIYFKKAIDECEMEWSTNKKLVNMAGKDVRRSVPKGLPYFWVSFGMKEGFAHVIEEQKYFPKYFAEEIIGGILDLHHSKWRRANAQTFDLQKSRLVEFSKDWTQYDCSKK